MSMDGKIQLKALMFHPSPSCEILLHYSAANWEKSHQLGRQETLISLDSSHKKDVGRQSSPTIP